MKTLTALSEDLDIILDEAKKKIWPDRNQIDYWRTMRDGLKVGFLGNAKDKDGIPVAGPRSMTGIDSPLSSKFKKKLPKGSFQAKAAGKTNMTMGALRFIQNVFGDQDVQEEIKKAGEWVKTLPSKPGYNGKYAQQYTFKNAVTGKNQLIGREYLSRAGVPDSWHIMKDNFLQHYGSPTSQGIRAMNLMLKLYGVNGSDSIKNTNFNKGEKLIGADGTIDKVRVLRAFHGPYRKNGVKIKSKNWTEEDIAAVEANVKKFFAEMYAINQWTLQEIAKKESKSTGNSGYKTYINKDGMMGLTRGTSTFSGVSEQDTAAVGAICVKYNLGVLCQQRPVSGFTLGAANYEASFPFGSSKLKPTKVVTNSQFANEGKFMVRTAMPIESCLFSMFAYNDGFSAEAEMMVMGSGEVPMRVTNLGYKAEGVMKTADRAEVKKLLKTRGFSHMIADAKGKKVDIEKSFLPGGMDYKGSAMKESMDFEDFEDFLAEQGW